MSTSIEWTDETWNPMAGCTKISEGCRNCYAYELHNMRHKAFNEGKKLPIQYSKPFDELQYFKDRLNLPFRWRKPRKVFVNSMSDLFHNDVPYDFIKKVLDVMWLNHMHTFQVLTKRPENMKNKIKQWLEEVRLSSLPRNIWIGTSAENQDAAKERIPILLNIPAKVHFISCEPLLGPVDLEFHAQFHHPDNEGYEVEVIKGLDWVIVGGESGKNARPMNPEWVEDIASQCKEHDVPFFFKQWGEFAPHDCESDYDPEHWITDSGYIGTVANSIPSDYNSLNYINRVGKRRAGRLLNGKEYNEMPSANERMVK